MIGIRKIFGFLMVMVFAAFAVPASADTKIFAIDASPSVAAGTAQTVVVKFNNLTVGNSSFNSISLTANASPGSLIITAASTDSAKAGTVTGLGTGAIQITDLSPTKVGKTLTVTLTVTATANGCNAGSVGWNAAAWTGSPGTPSNFFALQPTPGNRTTSITAPGCTYTFTTSPLAVNAGASTPMIATVKNTAASSGPAITSFVLTAPAGLTITGATGPSGTVTSNSTSVTVTGVSVTFGNSYPVSVTVSAAPSCTGSSAASWSSQVNSGVFTLSGSNPATSINAQACGMTLTAPTSAQVGVPFSVVANLSGGPGTASVVMTVTGSPSCGSFSGPTSVVATGGSATFPLTFNSLGTCTLAFSATGYPTQYLSNFVVYAGVLACDDVLDPFLTNPPNNTNPSTEPGWAGGKRGLFNKDGSTCFRVNYTFTNTILADDTVSLIWDTNVQPYADFTYTMNWKPRAVDADGWTAVRPLVAWQELSPGNPNFVPGLACLSTNLPAPYTTLVADNGGTIDVNVVVAPAVPFPIVIGTERMQVTSVSGTTWTVSRGQGGTLTAAHAATNPVMSTPLPIYPMGFGYFYEGKQAQVCIAEHGWSSFGIEPVTGKTLVMYTTTVIDIGDGFVKFP